MTVNNYPATPSAIQPYLIANAIGVDANALATTALNYAAGMTAANTFPLCMRIYRVTGTLALLVGSLKLNNVVIQPVLAAEAAVLAATSSALHYPISSTVAVQPVPVAGSYAFTVATINGGASTITVEVWGLRIS